VDVHADTAAVLQWDAVDAADVGADGNRLGLEEEGEVGELPQRDPLDLPEWLAMNGSAVSMPLIQGSISWLQYPAGLLDWYTLLLRP